MKKEKCKCANEGREWAACTIPLCRKCQKTALAVILSFTRTGRIADLIDMLEKTWRWNPATEVPASSGFYLSVVGGESFPRVIHFEKGTGWEVKPAYWRVIGTLPGEAISRKETD